MREQAKRLKNTLTGLLCKCWTYETITLKRFIEVQNTQNLRKLIRFGIYIPSIAAKNWEKIIEINDKMNGSNSLSVYKMNLKGYLTMLTNYMLVRSSLTYLHFKYDKDIVDSVLKHGIYLDTSNTIDFVDSLDRAIRYCDSMITLIESRRKAIESGSKKTELSFDELLIWLSYNLGFMVPRDVKLAEFNAYVKFLKHKQKDVENK